MDRMRRLRRMLGHAQRLLEMGRVEEARRVLDQALRLVPQTDR